MASITLYVIGFGRPDLLLEQGRLLKKYLGDSYELVLVDNTQGDETHKMEMACRTVGCGYAHSSSETGEHPEALNFAAGMADRDQNEFFGFLDHDIFPSRETSLIEKVEKTGFYGIGQRHAPTGRLYLWPGFCFFSRSWLGGRKLNFDGIRGVDKRDDGDCGSMNWPLFEREDWSKLWPMKHGYEFIREPDSYGLQSSGVEIIGDWVHLTNGSHWMKIPSPEERDRLTAELVAAL